MHAPVCCSTRLHDGDYNIMMLLRVHTDETLQFAVGVFTGEPLTALRLASFAFIWAGAAVFALAALWRKRAERQAIKTVVDAA